MNLVGKLEILLLLNLKVRDILTMYKYYYL